jgi:UDP-3-O-[3-hydroxymyristoyl] glucosamine N-acyltransferase
VEAAPAYLLSGSSLSSWWLRALGAKIGKEVIIGSMTLRAPDLLEIGDNVSVGNAVNFENARVSAAACCWAASRWSRMPA